MTADRGRPAAYLSVPVVRPRAAFFEFTSCEGCQLQILNNEENLVQFLSLLEIVNFREVMSERSDEYDIAFVEGCVTRGDEEEHLKKIRARTKKLIAFGTCACFGGVNSLKNRFSPETVIKMVYGDETVDTGPARALEEIVDVDLRIYGCPVNKEEVENIVVNLAVGRSVKYPKYPVCMECKRNDNICLYDVGEPCLGPVTRAGCNAWCPNNRCGCWGCRGPAEDANLRELKKIMTRHRISPEQILDRLECFGGFSRLEGGTARREDKLQH